MRRFIGIAAVLSLASAAHAQDTTVVVVRHLPSQQDTNVVVRHLSPAQQRTGPYGAPRYAPSRASVFAKDPNFGSFLSLIFPGGGQYYADRPGKGLFLTALGIGAPIIGFNAVNRDRFYYGGAYGGYSCNTPGPMAYAGGGDCRGHYDWTPAAVGLGVGITAWLYGVATAGSDVQHWNQAHGVRFMTGPGRMGFAVAVP
jgi:hypothetical protein